jgi:hypothetical protein
MINTQTPNYAPHKELEQINYNGPFSLGATEPIK